MYENIENSYTSISKPRFEKPFITPRNSLNFWRFPFSRRGMMSGRYPRMGFRHFSPYIMRPPNSIITGAIRYPINVTPTAVPSFYIQRPPFYMPLNVSDNEKNQPVLPDTVVNENKLVIESAEPSSGTSELNAFSDLWVESLGPGGRTYYYNNRTRQSTWEKPINAHVIELNEVKKLARPSVEQSERLRKENLNFIQQQPFSNNNYANVLYPKNFPMPRLIFPPNLSVPPPNFFRPPLENIQMIGPSCNVRYIVLPMIFPNPFVTNNLLPSNVMHEHIAGINQDILPYNNKIECDSKAAQDCSSNTKTDSFTNSEHILLPRIEMINHDNNAIENGLSDDKMNDYDATHTQDRFSEVVITNSFVNIHNDSAQKAFESSKSNSKEVIFVSSANDKASFSASGSNIYLSSSSDLTDLDTTKNGKKNTIQCKNEKLADLKPECENAKPEDSVLTESKCHLSTVNLTYKENRAGNSALVSCTPISGTNWCVVWTGDQRFFFYNSQRKVSVWERPTELLNRSDVNQMIKISPLLLGPKPLTKKVRKNSSYPLDRTKKIKKESEFFEIPGLKENSTSKETIDSVKVDSVQTTNNTSEVENTSNSIFSDISDRCAEDFRFKAIGEIKLKKSLFNQYVFDLKKEDRERDQFENEQTKSFIELSSENSCIGKEWSEVQNILDDDERFKVILGNVLKENRFKKCIRENSSAVSLVGKEKCLGEKEKRDLSIYLKNQKKKQETYKYTRAMSNFKAMLEDLIKDSDVSWQTAEKVLKADHRWKYSQDLESEKCRVFHGICQNFKQSKKR